MMSDSQRVASRFGVGEVRMRIMCHAVRVRVPMVSCRCIVEVLDIAHSPMLRYQSTTRHGA